MVLVSELKDLKNQVDEVNRLKSKYPNWLFKRKDIYIYGFRDIRILKDPSKPESIENSFPVMVRVSLHGIFFFSKKENVDKYYTTEGNFLSSEDFKGMKGKGIHPVGVGFGRMDGTMEFLDCVFEPGIFTEHFDQIINVFQDITQPYYEKIRTQGGNK